MPSPVGHNAGEGSRREPGLWCQLEARTPKGGNSACGSNMAYPNRGLVKAAMGHYLTEGAHTALEAMEPEEDVIDMGPGKRMPVVGPNQVLDMPLFTKIPLLPGSNTMFYTTNLGEKLFQPSATFDLSDPYCKVMAPRYHSLHDPHLRAYYKRKGNLRRLRKAGFITDKNRVVCTLKEFNEYRQYLTSLKLEFEKNYIREQKMLEKQVTKLQERHSLPEAADTSKYRDWLLKEERPTIQEQESAMRNRYLELINQELSKLEQLAEENQRLALAQDDKKKEGFEKRKQLLLRKKMEEEWRKKEMTLLMKIGEDVKREARLEEQRRKSQEAKLKRKQAMLEKKMAYHLGKLQERFGKEGLLLPPSKIFSTTNAMEEQSPGGSKQASSTRKTSGGSKTSQMDRKPSDSPDDQEAELQKGGPTKGKPPSKPPSLATLNEAPLASKSATGSLEPETVSSQKELSSRKASRDSGPGDSLRHVGSGRVSFASRKEVVSMGSNENPLADVGSSAGSTTSKITASASGGCLSNGGGASLCGASGCGSKTSCCGSGGCGSKTSCCGSGGCGSKTSCCGSGGCGSKTSCCGSGGCGSKTSCCGSGGCGSKTSCCGSGGCGSKTSCCGSGGCGSNNSKGAGGYDSSGSSSRQGNSSRNSKAAGADSLPQTTEKTLTKLMASSGAPQHGGESSSKAKQKKRATVVSEADSQVKDRRSGKKSGVEKGKTGHLTFPLQENEDSESSYSAYLQHLLSTSDQTVIRESLKGKVSPSELSSILQNVMTWVVSAVTSILYPALTRFEERVRARVYTISEESVLSSDNSSSCSTCNEELYSSQVSAQKVSFTNTSIKAPGECRAAGGKAPLLSSKSSFSSFTKSTQVSLGSEVFKGKFKRGKTAIVLCPSKHRGLLSTAATMRSSKSDSHVSRLHKGGDAASERRKHGAQKGLLLKTDTTTTDTDGAPLGGGERQPARGPREPGGAVDLRDLKSVFAGLKCHLAQITALSLEDVFKRIWGDLGFMASSVSITMEVLLESVSQSLLGDGSGGLPHGSSVSRIASFVASDIVEDVLRKLHSTAQRKYLETVCKEDFSAGRKAMCIIAAGKHPSPDSACWRARMPLSFEAVYGVAEEIVHIITDKLKVFATSSQAKLSQLELCARIKAIGIPLEKIYAAIPPHTVESEAANAIVKDTIRKIVSKTIASSETDILQYVEEMVCNILNYVQRQMSQEGILPTRESSMVLQIINDIFNDLSLEKLHGALPLRRSRAGSAAGGGLAGREASPGHETEPGAATITTLYSAESRLRTPLPPVNVPGMAVYAEAEAEGKEKMDPDGTFSSVKKERTTLVTEEGRDKIRHETVALESLQRSRPGAKSALQGEGAFLETDGKAEPRRAGEAENGVEGFVQEAIFCSFEGRHRAPFPTGQLPEGAQPARDGGWSLQQALKKMEDDFKDGEQSTIVQITRNLLNDVFQHIWTEHSIWPPATPPPSLAHLGIHKPLPEEKLASKGQPGGPAVVSDVEVAAFTGDLVRSVFQKLSCAAVADAEGVHSPCSNLVFTDIFPPQGPPEAGKGPLAVHFRDPEMSFESGHTKAGSEPTAGATQDPDKPAQADLQSLPSKAELAGDLLQTLVAKLECFVASKVESQFSSEVQNLKSSASADFSSAIHQDLRRFLAPQEGGFPGSLEDIFNSCHNSLFAEQDKTKQAPPLSYSHLKTYAEEVARLLLQTLKYGLDQEVERILIAPIVFSESIAASQIVNMVLAIFSPLEPQQDSILEKLFRKNPGYKKDIQRQIHSTIETVLNEIYQTLMLGSGNPLCPSAPGMEEAADTREKGSSRPAVTESDISLVARDLVDVVTEDLSSSLAAGMSAKGELSARLQSLLFNLLQKTVQPLALGTGRHHTSSLSRAEKRKMDSLGAQHLSDLRQCSDVTAKYLVDNVFLRLESFAEDKTSIHGFGPRTTEGKVSRSHEGAKVALQDSHANLRLCAEKLTCTILKLIQTDLEREMLSCQNILPYKENVSANEMMKDLLRILAVQIALTENEVQKRVVKRIFRRKEREGKGGGPLLSQVEDILNQLAQRLLGDLPSLGSDSMFLSSESKSSSYSGALEAASQGHTGSVAGDIVDGVLGKMYSVVVDTLFSPSESGGRSSSSSNQGALAAEASSAVGKADFQKMTLELSQVHPVPRTLGEELVQNVLNKIASFAASSLEEILPSSLQRQRKAFQHDMHAGDGGAGRPRAFSDDSESSLTSVSLSKSSLTVYAKEVVSKVLGTVLDEFKREDYNRTILRIHTLSSEQISVASNLVHSVVRDLHADEGPVSHVHRHTFTRHDKADGAQVTVQFESTTKESRTKAKCLFYDDFASYLKKVLPKRGILREIFERQPLTDANINENLKMLQVAENVVGEVFMKVRDLEPSVCLLKKIPGELSERLFCCGLRRTEPIRLFHSDSQAEIGSIARDIIASVFENVHRCLVQSAPTLQDGFLGRREGATSKGAGPGFKHRFTQPEFPFYNVSLKGAKDTIDTIARETVECVILTLETFVARHFRRDFNCNFLEIVKSPPESLSVVQLTRSSGPVSSEVGNAADPLGNKAPGAVGEGVWSALGSTHHFLGVSKLGGSLTKERIEAAIRQVQVLHAELSVYANNAVSGILEIIKQTLDRQLSQKEATLFFSSSSESLALSETISVMLDHCTESLTEITSELMVEDLQLGPVGQALMRDPLVAPVVKTTSTRLRRVDTRDGFPPINVPGMVIYSEEEVEVQGDVPSKLPSVFKAPKWDAYVAPEGCRGRLRGTPAPRPRLPRRPRQDRGVQKFRRDLPGDDWLPQPSCLPEGSVLEKLLDSEAAGTGRPHYDPFPRSLANPERTCYSIFCPLKLDRTAETIVNTLLCEFGLEKEQAAQAGRYEKFGPLFPLEGRPALATFRYATYVEPKQKKHGLLGRWEQKRSDSSERSTSLEEGGLPRQDSSLLSKWESKHCIFKGPKRATHLELVACGHVPDPCEVQLLASHIVLSVIQELITVQPRDAADSLPTWRQELIRSESKWLQECIWRSSFLPASRKPSSCLDLFWEPLTRAVVGSLLLSVSKPSTRQNARERSEFFGSSLSMFCSVDTCCPEHGLGGPRCPPLDLAEFAFQISEAILDILCERNILRETVDRKGPSARKAESIHVPPLCLADFDSVYHLLVQEVGSLLALGIETRGRFGSEGRVGDILCQQPFIPAGLSGASRGDCRGPLDIKDMAGLSARSPAAHNHQRLSCTADKLDHFIRSLKSSESKQIVNKVLHIILESLWPSQPPQGSLVGLSAGPRKRMLPPEASLPARGGHAFPSSVCPHVYQLGDSLLGSSLGLSPKSIVLLDLVSEKLIRNLLDKCLATEHLTGSFVFEDLPEDEQLCDLRKHMGSDETFQFRETGEHEDDSVYTYNIKYSEEPEVEVQSAPSAYESALDVLAHTLVRPVMTELSLSVEHPGHAETYSRRTVGFTQPTSRKAHGQPFGKKKASCGWGEGYSSLPRGRKPEPKAHGPGRHRKSTRDKSRFLLETSTRHRTFGSKTMPPAGRRFAPTTTTKRSFRREVVVVTGHGDHGQPRPAFSAIYSALFLEEVLSQLLIKTFTSLHTKFDGDSYTDLNNMNALFVNALVEEFKKAGVGILQRAEERSYFPLVDSQTIHRIVDAIVQELGFQLAADRGIGGDFDVLAERVADVILVEILDYQLPPPVCRRLPQSAFRSLQAEPIIQRVKHCMCLPSIPKKRQPPPTYVTVLSQKYLERVINQLVSQLFPPSDGTAQKPDQPQLSGADFDELCCYMINRVMKSISKHKIWVAKKDDRCRLHSKEEIQQMVDSVYKNMLKKSGSRLSIQRDAKSQNTDFVDCMTNFILQEVTNQHLQTFLPNEGAPSRSPDPTALSENIVRTVLGSIGGASASHAGVFPARFLEEIVSRVLSKVFHVSLGQKEGRCEDKLGEVVKQLASSINLQFGKAAAPALQTGEGQSLEPPLAEVMEEVVDSVCEKMLREREAAPDYPLGDVRDKALFEDVKRWIGKGISDCLLHPLFSGDLPTASPSSSLDEDVGGNAGDELEGAREGSECRSPFSTFLSSGLLKDVITGLLSKIFPSTPPRGATSPREKGLPSEGDLSRLSAQLLNDVRAKLLKHEIRVTKETTREPCEYSEEDVQSLTDSLCNEIIQKSGSLEAARRDMRNKNFSLIDRIAGFLVGDLLQQHIQPFVSRQRSPSWDRAAAGDSPSGLEAYKTMIKPLDLRQLSPREPRGAAAGSTSPGEFLRELFSKLLDSLSDAPLGASGEDVEDTTVRLVKAFTKELAKAQLSIQEGPEEALGSAPGGPRADEDEKGTCQMAVTYEEAVGRQLQSACPPDLGDAQTLIQRRLMDGPAGALTRAPVPYTTTISYPVLEAIVDRLLARIFPPPSGTATCSGEKEGPLGNKVAQIRQDIMATVLRQAIWISSYGRETEAGIAEEAVESMVESVYCDVLHEVLLQQPLQGDRESLSNLYVTKIACFIINEMFKYHLRSLTSAGAPSLADAPLGDLPASSVTVFPCSLLERLLSCLLEKIFPNPESVAAYTGSQADFSEADFVEMATNLKSYVITEVSAHEIRLENTPERVPEMDQETEDDIASSVYNQILQKSESQSELQRTLAGQGTVAIHEMANLLIRELLNFHLHPFLSGSDATKSDSNQGQPPQQQQDQPFSLHIYSATFLEDVVVAFFCKMLSSPNILAYSKDSNLSENEMRDLVTALVTALVDEFKASTVKVIQRAEDHTPFPQVAAEEVVEIGSSVYDKLLQVVGSEFELFKAFQNDSPMLAERLASLVVKQISGYQFQPLFTGDTSPYLFSFLEAETIVNRVEAILPETVDSSSSVFEDMFCKVLQRIFPSWAPRGTSDSYAQDEHHRTAGEVVTRGFPVKEGAGSDAQMNMQNFVQDIYKSVCARSVCPSRKYDSEELVGFASKAREGYHAPGLASLPAQPHPSSVLSAKTAGWTIHHVKLGEGESQPMPVEDKEDIYSSAFLKDIFSGLVSKLISSTMLGKKEADTEPSVTNLVESILKEFIKSPVKVLQIPEGGQALPAVGQAEIAKIIHATLCGILQDRGHEAPICTDDSNHILAQQLASSIKREILGYQIKEAKSAQSSASEPFELGAMTKQVLTEVRKIRTPSQMSWPGPLLVSQRFIHDVLAALLAKVLPLPMTPSTSTDTEGQCAEFDFIHMKLLGKVTTDLAKDTKVQYLDRFQPSRVVSQTVANSIYGNLLPEFGTTAAVEKCMKAGCTILAERISDLVIQEISGNQIQRYLSEELNRQQEADAEDEYGGSPQLPEGETSAALRSHLKGLSAIILEEVAVKFLSKMFHALPLDDLDERSVSAVKEVAKKMIDALQGIVSRKKLKVWQPDDGENLDSADSRTVGEVVDSIYTDVITHSSSETSLYDDLTSENEDFVNRVACIMVSEISRRDFQSAVDSEGKEDLVPGSSTTLKLETDKIVQKFLDDMELEKAKQAGSVGRSLIVSVLFVEEILSRLLTQLLLEQHKLRIAPKEVLSKVDLNDMAGQLAASVEKEMSKNKIGLVDPEDWLVLHPQEEDKVDKVVSSVISNVLEKSGSHLEIYKDMTDTKAIFPEQVASIIINEISSCSIHNPFAENVQSETFSALELDRIVSKVLARVSSHLALEKEASDPLLDSLLPSAPVEEVLLESGEVPLKIVPYIGDKPLDIDPEIVSDHLAVLSIKTEPLEKLKKTCLSKTGMSLTEVRRVSASGKSLTSDIRAPDPSKKKERRSSLDTTGRLGVLPNEVVCRNSFQSLMKPDIRKVELLKDVESKEDLIIRLVAHDINDPQHMAGRRPPHELDMESEERVLKEHKSFYFEVPSFSAGQDDSEAQAEVPSEPDLPKAASTFTRKRSLSLGKCCRALTASSTTAQATLLRGKVGTAPLPQIEISSQSSTSQPQPSRGDTADTPPESTTATGAGQSGPHVPSAASPERAHPRKRRSDDKEKTLEEAVVDMHLSRDTEETLGPFEITSVYQDKNIKDSAKRQAPGDGKEEGKVAHASSSEVIVPVRQRSSVLGKVSSTLARVFSKTSANNLAQPEQGEEKPPEDQAK